MLCFLAGYYSGLLKMGMEIFLVPLLQGLFTRPSFTKLVPGIPLTKFILMVRIAGLFLLHVYFAVTIARDCTKYEKCAELHRSDNLYVFCGCLFVLILYVPVNKFSVMSGRVFLG